MRINHNIAALNTYRQLTSNNANGSKSIEKLSSGLRINRAGDDAAGLAISEKMRGQIKGLEMASNNAQNGISLIQTAEGALNETHSILQRMRELSVQASNDTQTDSDRAELQKEIEQLTSEIDRISSTTEFNTKKLLNGDLSKATEAKGDILQSAKVTYDGITAANATSDNVVGKEFNITGDIDISFSGAAGVTVTLNSGNYTESGLVAALNSGFNGEAVASISNGVLNIKASGGDVQLSGAGWAQLGLDTGTTITDGTTLDGDQEAGSLDVATSITFVSDVVISGHVAGGGGASGQVTLSGGRTYTQTELETVLSGVFNGLSVDVKWSGNSLKFANTDSGALTVSVAGSGGPLGMTGNVNVATGQSGAAADSGAFADRIQIGDNNNEFIVSVDGTDYDVDIANGVYTASAFATAVNTALDGATASGATGISGLRAEANGASGINFYATDGTKDYEFKKATGDSGLSGLGITAGTKVDNIGNPTNIQIGSGNDQLTVSVNDGTAVTVQIASGNYTAATLATAVQTALNGASGVSGITVSAGSGADTGKLVFAPASGDQNSYSISNASGDTAVDAIGYNADFTIQNSVALTDLKDADGDTLNITSGDVIKFNGKYNGTAVSEISFTVSGGSTVKDLGDAIAAGIASGVSGLSANEIKVSVTSDGKIQFAGKDGEENAIEDFALSTTDNDKFNNYFANFAETQDAADVTTNDSLVFHIGANENQTVKVDVNEMSSESLNLASVDIGTQQGAENSITVINNAIESVSAERAKLGAYQNRLEHTINNLGTSAENLTAAESRIRDVDMAKEMMSFTKNNILTQAAQSMLAQANQQPQGVLQLLR